MLSYSLLYLFENLVLDFFLYEHFQTDWGFSLLGLTPGPRLCYTSCVRYLYEWVDVAVHVNSVAVQNCR